MKRFNPKRVIAACVLALLWGMWSGAVVSAPLAAAMTSIFGTLMIGLILL